MQQADIVGWLASAILILTLAHQIHKQWQDSEPSGVSIWLFVGQISASVGFVVYSVMLGNWVFIVTNALILLTAVVGQWVTVRKRREQ
jgi:MtN3 and saliva related transmembrane protein